MANEFITNEHTSIIDRLVREVVNDPSTYKGSQFIPSVAKPVRKIRNEVIEASGGLTTQHLVGTDTKYVQSFGHRAQEFQAPQYKEAIHYDETKLLYLRELGQQDVSKEGIKQYIDLDADRLNRRLEARIEFERWNAIFTGAFTWMGSTFSYGIPAANQAVPLGAVWSADLVNQNDSANPLKDYRYWTTGGLAGFRKYKITKAYMNGNTARWMLDNANTKAFVASIGANSAFAGPGFDLDAVIKFAVPGAPPIEVYNGWYQTESVDSAGRITVSNATYFIPDGYIWFQAALPGGDLIGEFVQGSHLASGSIQSPGYGKFFVVEDNIASGTKGGPKNPYMDLVAGVYGGVNLYRPFDVLTAKVI